MKLEHLICSHAVTDVGIGSWYTNHHSMKTEHKYPMPYNITTKGFPVVTPLVDITWTCEVQVWGPPKSWDSFSEKS